MVNNFLILGTLTALGWVFVNGPPPSTELTAKSPVSRVAATGPSVTSYDSAGRRPALEMRRDPVPLVRNVRVSPASPVASASNETSTAPIEQQAQDDLDRRAAKAAVEQDGYKRVIVVGKASNGAWRAKGFRGTTEV